MNGSEARIRRIDPDLGRRYDDLASTARKIFRDSNLIEESIHSKNDIIEKDICAIDEFLEKASPVNPKQPWRKDNKSDRQKRPQVRLASNFFPHDHMTLYDRKLVTTRAGDPMQYIRMPDGSTYGTWDSIGGAEEHIHLSGNAAEKVTIFLQKNLKPVYELQEPALTRMLRTRIVKPLHMKAAGKFHDVGRLFTHGFFTNETIGDAFLKRIGIREDIRRILPTEDVMLAIGRGPVSEKTIIKMIMHELKKAVENGEALSAQEANDLVRTRLKEFRKGSGNLSIERKIESLSPQQVIMRIADEFGKRFPKSDRLYQPEDYDEWDRQGWADGYIKKPDSGRPTDRHWRKYSQIHVDNVPAYFAALDKWIQSISTVTLKEVTEMLQQELGPTLPRLNQ